MPAYLSPLANHVWQSTVFAGLAGLLRLAFRKNRALVRYWIWLAASVKFLIPFLLLVSLGGQLGWRTASPVAQPRFSFVMDEIRHSQYVTRAYGKRDIAYRGHGAVALGQISGFDDRVHGQR